MPGQCVTSGPSGMGATKADVAGSPSMLHWSRARRQAAEDCRQGQGRAPHRPTTVIQEVHCRADGMREVFAHGAGHRWRRQVLLLDGVWLQGTFPVWGGLLI